VNVWLALTHERHSHHGSAARWLDEQDGAIYFCRFTQLGLLRLLTNERVMRVDVLTQRAAWRAYHRWFDDDRVAFHEELDAPGLARALEELSTQSGASTKLWADAYLAAFARTAGLSLVTFDRALRAMPQVSVELLDSARI
jgi:hypothetical protein